MSQHSLLHSPGHDREWSDQDVLTMVAVGATAVLWPVGLVLAWANPRWKLADKLVATLLPIGGLMFSLLVLPAGARGLGLSTPAGMNWLIELGHYGGLMGVPLVAALYLGVRAGLSRRLLAGLLLLALLVLALAQLAFFLGSQLQPGRP
ncbi:hypothetical protein NET03_03785 [Thermomicrobium sp. CFH 73360]|uniref:hypothetical protein n=1 Tax=Thermomicrobium sp. CFH 73360 TaxID=2951987 RepID=UPI002076A965|nr:hypothetical protein [Thermomicrobium sp. CFH 73360]MCM8745645.1 hypothetical protein [Thermomicrobium sp. CFH 73360]